MTANTPRVSPAPPAPHRPSARRTLRTGATVFVGVLVVAFVVAAAPQLRPPRAPSVIERVLAQGPHAGDCEQCHTTHASDQPIVYPNALTAPDDNTLCQRCHTTPWAGGSYAGGPLFLGTGHGSSPTMIWPGSDPPARIDFDAPGKCLNCHDPHGWTDVNGLIPHLAIGREERLCLACHDGHPATTNIQVDLQKPYRHPVTDRTGRHTGPDEIQPTSFGITPIDNRHAECTDCHNPHVSRADGLGRPVSLDASATTLGVSRVAVLNGAAGTPATFLFVPASDTLTTPFSEYQLCFKCHSSWTTQPSGKTDLALVLNPSNPSFHPIEATGRNLSIDTRAFVPGWKSTSLTRCGDCHGSDFGSVRGPHGSIFAGLLRRQYEASPLERTMLSDELCFACHSYEVYADPSAPEAVRSASRFNGPRAEKGHAEHVGEERVPCYACHVTHGSTTQPFLITLGRTPGIRSYTSDLNGGTCTATCHGSESYSVNYAR